MMQAPAQWVWFVDDALVHKFLSLDTENPALARRAAAHPALTTAVRSRLEGAPDRALAELRPAVGAGDLDALLLTAQIQFELCRFEEAAAAYARLAERDPATRIAAFNQGLCLARLGRWQAAVECLQRAAASDPDRMEVWLTLGICLLNVRRAQGADSCFKQALRVLPEYVPALAGRAAALQMAGDHATALGIYNRLLDSQPRRVELVVNALSCATALRDHQRIAGLTARLEELQPQHPAVAVARVVSAIEREDFEQGARLTVELAAREPRVGAHWYNLGVCHDRRGRYKEALEAFEHALEIDPADAQALEGKARAAAAAGLSAVATAAWRALAQADAENAVAWYEAGRLEYEAQRFAEAAECFDHAGGRPLELGLSLWKAGDLASARTALESAVAAEPANQTANTALLAVLAESDPDAALARCRDTGVEHAGLAFNLALVCESRGDASHAEALYRRALEIDAGFGAARLNLGLLRYGAGARREAGELWQAALDADPSLAAHFRGAWS